MNPNNPTDFNPVYSGNPSENSPYTYRDAKKPIEDPKISRFKEHLGTIVIILLAPLLAFLITAFVFRTYQVDGPSMETTLQNNDRLIIDKVPRTWSRITHHQYIPNRYDIIVFKHHGQLNGDLGGSQAKQLI